MEYIKYMKRKPSIGGPRQSLLLYHADQYWTLLK